MVKPKLLLLLLLSMACTSCEEPDYIDGEVDVIIHHRGGKAEYKPTHMDSLVIRAYKTGKAEGYSEGYSSHFCSR